MKKNIMAVVVSLLACAGIISYTPSAEANGWGTAGKIIAGVAGVDLLFNGRNSMVGRTVTGVGNVFTGGNHYNQQTNCGYQPESRRCWEETRRIPAYDSRENFLGYFDKRVTVCTEY